MKYEILELINARGKRIAALSEVRNLSDFHAIIVDPRFAVLIDGSVDVAPGQVEVHDDLRWLPTYQQKLAERSAQLGQFFAAGGTLVVRLVEESKQAARTRAGDVMTVSSHEWFERWIANDFSAFREARLGPLVLTGYGGPIELREPGHALAPYLLHRNAYAARLNPSIAQFGRTTVLAVNRGGDPVAVEIAIGRGSIVLIPPPADAEDERLIREGTERLAYGRVGIAPAWPLRAEVALRDERAALLARHTSERDELDVRMKALLAVKQQVLDEPEVRRAIAYYEKAARAASPRLGLPVLYNLVEMLKDYYECGDDAVADKVGVTRATIEAIKRPLNQSRYDIRHAKAGEPEDLPADLVNSTMKAGAETVVAFIETRYREATAAHDAQTGPMPMKADSVRGGQ